MKLPGEHQRAFQSILREHFLPAIAAGSFTGNPPWPTRLRVHRLTRAAIYSITWSFAGPDGRATFHLETGADGAAILVWRRIGTHAIYDRP
ncbi:hypothetical protein [Actinopolymorpha pittospori]|uniref:Uncharacterized protein n=1 Tax=Actinopolymorpha pittospori TaxID=648752 RepID=A0A927R619_9ACTN|nr:hypothetical protein [Actinopolymorpha pittospori]MBE1603962.1 hypothetical protein [Actinopolymorpha pittospori]